MSKKKQNTFPPQSKDYYGRGILSAQEGRLQQLKFTLQPSPPFYLTKLDGTIVYTSK